MPKREPAPRAIRQIGKAIVALAVLGSGILAAGANEAGSPTSFDQRGKGLHTFEWYREHGAYGRKGERLNPNDPRGHMSHGHGGGHS